MLFKDGKIRQLEWDLSTVTAGDYTVEFQIPAPAYQRWYTDTYKSRGGDCDQGFSPALSLKRTLINQIESALGAEVDKLKSLGST